MNRILAGLLIFANATLMFTHFFGPYRAEEYLSVIYLFLRSPWSENLNIIVYSANLIIALFLFKKAYKVVIIILGIEAILNFLWLLTLGLVFYAMSAEGGEASQLKAGASFVLLFFFQILFLFWLSRIKESSKGTV